MKILVLTRNDDCCGPMAAAFLRDYSQKLEALSAGTNPLENIQTLVITAMKECLIDLSGTKPRDVSRYEINTFDFIIKIGDSKEFQQYEGTKTICLNPSIEVTSLDSMRQLRDWIKNEVFIVYKTHLH